MADFSLYAGPSAEWRTLEPTLPPPPDLSQPVTAIRKAVNDGRETVSKAEFAELAPKLTTTDYSILTRDGQTIEARTYRSNSIPDDQKLPIYVHLHGGGFVFGTLSSEDPTCGRIAINSRVVVLNVNYRHTPEHPYPAAWNDSEDALLWLHKNISSLKGDGEKVVVGGISAGAWLTASLVIRQYLGQALNDIPKVKGQVLFIPPLAHPDCYGPQWARMKSPEISSFYENANAPVLGRNMVEFFNKLLKIPNLDPKDLRVNPGNATVDQVKGLPPTVFGIAGLDPLRDDGLLFAQLLAEAGVPTDTFLFPGVPHGFRRFGKGLQKECDRWDKTMEEGIVWALSGPKTGKFDVKLK